MFNFSKLNIINISISILLISGCAQIPELTNNVEPFDVTTHMLKMSKSTGNNINWPANDWWKKYEDSQLNDLIQIAFQHAPDMSIAKIRTDRARATADAIRTYEDPQLSGKMSATSEKLSYNYLTPETMTPQGYNDYGRTSLDFNWEIDFWNKNKKATSAAMSEYYAKQAEQEQAKLLLSTAITNNYIELHKLFLMQETTTKIVEVREKTLKLLNERYEHGLDNKANVKQAESRKYQADAELLKINEAIDLQKNKINILIGKGPNEIDIKKTQLHIDNIMDLPSNLDINLIGRRPDIIAAKWIVQSQLTNEEKKKTEFYPNINLIASIGLQSLGLNMLTQSGSMIGSFGPAITLPVFHSSRLRSELKVSHAAYEEAVANYNKNILQALHETENGIITARALTMQKISIVKSTNAAKEAYTLMQQRYKQGVSNYIEVLNTEDTYINTIKSLDDINAKVYSTDVAIIKALGGGYTNTTNTKEEK